MSKLLLLVIVLTLFIQCSQSIADRNIQSLTQIKWPRFTKRSQSENSNEQMELTYDADINPINDINETDTEMNLDDENNVDQTDTEINSVDEAIPSNEFAAPDSAAHFHHHHHHHHHDEWYDYSPSYYSEYYPEHYIAPEAHGFFGHALQHLFGVKHVPEHRREWFGFY